MRYGSPPPVSVRANLLKRFDALSPQEPEPKKIKRADAFLVESDSQLAAQYSFDLKEAMKQYEGNKHFGMYGYDTPATVLDGATTESQDSIHQQVDNLEPPASQLDQQESLEPPASQLDQESLEPPAEQELPEPPAEDSNLAEVAEPPAEVPEVPQASPQDAETEEEKRERQKERNRVNSRAWHAKWVKKGVPKQPEQPVIEEPAPVIPDQNDQPVRDMRVACREFIAKWISESDMAPSNERRTAAYRAWMESDERSALMAGRAGVQQ